MNKILQLIWAKLTTIMLRIIHVVVFIPKRLSRIVFHFKFGFSQLKRRPTIWNYLFWLFELILLFLDLVGVSELYECIQEIIKPNSRPLSQHEVNIAKEYFGNQLIINRIRVDSKAFLGPPQHRFAYVSFFTINSWGALSDDVFLHELVHIWQYQNRGIIYMTRALAAQFGKRGYNYGGVDLLRKLKKRGRRLDSFNPEHQAEIVQDCYILKQRIKSGTPNLEDDLQVYQWFVNDLIMKR